METDNSRRIRFPIVSKISTTILVLMALSIGFSAFWMARNMNRMFLRNSEKDLVTSLHEKTREIKMLLDTGQRVAFQVASSSSVIAFMEDGERKESNKILAEIKNFPINPEIVNIYLLDTDGKTILSRDLRFLGNNYGFRNYFMTPLSGVPVVESAIGVTTKEFGIYYGVPINKGKKVVGVVVVKLVPQRIITSLNESYLSRVGYFFLVDKNGVVFYSNKPDTLYKSLGEMSDQLKKRVIEGKSYSNIEMFGMQYANLQKLVEKGEEFYVGSEKDEAENKNELFGLSKIGDYPFFLVEEEDLDEIAENIRSIVTSTVSILLGSVLVSSGIIILLIVWLLRPIRLINKYAKSVSEGNLDEEVIVKTGDEMESVGNSIREMVAKLKELNNGLETKVAEKTAELEKTLLSIEGKNKDLENTKKAVLNVMEDLSEEKERISNQKNRIETILASIGDGVFVTDKDGKITMMNKAAQDMSGHSLFEALDKKYFDVLRFKYENDIEKPYPDLVKSVFDSGNPQSLQNHSVIVHKNGTITPVLDSAAPIKDVSGKIYGCVVVFRDNTRERELEKSKDDFMSVTSHQLRTPLGSMRWNLEMLLGGDAGKLSAEAEKIATDIHKGNLRMIELVNDLLNVNRIDQGKVMDDPVKTDPVQIIKDVIAELNFEVIERKIKIELDLEKIPMIVIDAKRFREVAMNLISNAVKYNKDGGNVAVSLKKIEERMVLSVKDSGVGIPQKDIHYVFGKFFRASNAVKSETEGSGLGLYVVKKFVDGWGGMITLESEEGKGTTITIALPVNKLIAKK